MTGGSNGNRSGATSYAVHPSFARPIELTPQMELGITTAHMGDWPDRHTEEQQETQLRALWEAVCEWTERHFVDRVYVDSFPREHSTWFIEKGFAVPPRTRGSRAGLQYVGSPQEVARRMSDAFAVPTLFLSASAFGSEIVRVADLSWDSIFVYTNEPPVLFS